MYSDGADGNSESGGGEDRGRFQREDPYKDTIEAVPKESW
jgi:hypothetical protein